MALLKVHGAVEQGNEGCHDQPGQVVCGGPPVHGAPLLHQRKCLQNKLLSAWRRHDEVAGHEHTPMAVSVHADD